MVGMNVLLSQWMTRQPGGMVLGLWFSEVKCTLPYVLLIDNNILVRNCGDFFVYRLQRPPGCQYRYCGVGYLREKPCSLI